VTSPVETEKSQELDRQIDPPKALISSLDDESVLSEDDKVLTPIPGLALAAEKEVEDTLEVTQEATDPGIAEEAVDGGDISQRSWEEDGGRAGRVVVEAGSKVSGGGGMFSMVSEAEISFEPKVDTSLQEVYDWYKTQAKEEAESNAVGGGGDRTLGGELLDKMLQDLATAAEGRDEKSPAGLLEVEKSVYEMVAADLAKCHPHDEEGKLLWRVWRWGIDQYMREDDSVVDMNKTQKLKMEEQGMAILTKERKIIEDLEDAVMDREDELKQLKEDHHAALIAMKELKAHIAAKDSTIARLSTSLSNEKTAHATSRKDYENLNARTNIRVEENIALKEENEMLKLKLAHAEVIAAVRSRSPMVRPPTAAFRRGISPRASLDAYETDKVTHEEWMDGGDKHREICVETGLRCVEIVRSHWMHSKAALDAMARFTGLEKATDKLQHEIGEEVIELRDGVDGAAPVTEIAPQRVEALLNKFVQLLETVRKGRDSHINKVLTRMTCNELSKELDLMGHKACDDVPQNIHPIPHHVAAGTVASAANVALGSAAPAPPVAGPGA